jgi:hypothetical protein
MNPDVSASWQNTLDVLIAKAKSSGDDLLLAAAQRLSAMSSDQFNHLYLEDQPLDSGVSYSGSGLEIGHVAIVGQDTSNELYVIEATTPATAGVTEILTKCFDNGVKRTPYSDWAKTYGSDLIWQGRPYPSLASSERARIPIQAMKYLGRPYCFDKLHLGDSTAFYCSKLVWLSVRESLDKFIDDDSTARRRFWLSPKQLLGSKNVNVLFSPGNYGCLPG